MLKVSYALFVLCMTGVAACTSAEPCLKDGTVHPPGEMFRAADGCNACSCTSDGMVLCTEIFCITPTDASDAGANDATDASANDAGHAGPRVDGSPESMADESYDRLDPTMADASSDLCTVDTIYHFQMVGGLTAYDDESAINPPAGYAHSRHYHGGDATISRSCGPALPPCGAADVISMRDIVRDLHHVDVAAVLDEGAAPLFGFDPRPADGQIFVLARHDGHGFSVGSPCTAGDESCRPVPAGVAVFVQDLRRLDEQMLAKPQCALIDTPP